MTTIIQKKFTNYLSNIKDNELPKLYLFFGEKILIKQSVKELLKIIFNGKINTFSINTFDLNNETDISQAINSLKTFSLFLEKKIIIIKNHDHQITKKHSTSNILKRNENDSSLYEKNTKYPLETFNIKNIKKTHKNISNTKYDNNLKIILNTIKHGFQKKHYLILIFNIINKKNKLFKIIQDQGLIVNCTVQNNNKNNKGIIQKSVFNTILNKILNKAQKNISKNAYNIIIKMTGHDLNIFLNNLNKLIDYVGKQKIIYTKDVLFLIDRTKKDTIFNLTNAIFEQKLEYSLFYLNSLLLDNIHPMQILTAIINKTRNLILAKEFILTNQNKSWKRKQSFIQFNNLTLKSIQKYISNIKNITNTWNDIPTNKTEKYNNLFFISENKSPYNIYSTMLQADNIKLKFLYKIMKKLYKIDIKLKSTKSNPKQNIISIIFFITKHLYYI